MLLMMMEDKEFMLNVRAVLADTLGQRRILHE
jgi:hypothetical protein